MAGQLNGRLNAQAEADLALVRRVQKGDKDAFYALVKRYQRLVWRQCMRIAQNVAIADELAQQVFLKAYDKLHTFRGEAPFGAWLCRIAFNTGKDWKRSERFGDTVTIEEVEIPVPSRDEETLGRQKELQALRQAVAQLPEKQREVVLLRIYEDYSFKEIAQATGATEGSAKVNFHYALKALKMLMKGSI